MQMKCFVLLCVLAVVGVSARPSAEVPKSAKDALSGDIDELKDLLKDVGLQDIDANDVLKAVADGIQSTPIGQLITGIVQIFAGKRDIEANLSQEDVDKLNTLLKDVDVQDITPDDVFNVALMAVKTNPLGRFLDGLATIFRGKKDLPADVDVQDITPDDVFNVALTAVKTNPLGRFLDGLASLFRGKKDLPADVDVQDITPDDVFNVALTAVKTNPLGRFLDGLASLFRGKKDLPVDVQDFDLEDITGVLAKISSAWSKIVAGSAPVINQIPFGKLGKRDELPVELQDTDWDAVLGHITGIAGDIQNNAKAILPTIISILGGIGKRDLPVDVDVEDFDLADITGFIEKMLSIEL